MKKNDLSVFEMEKEGFKIMLKKGLTAPEATPWRAARRPSLLRRRCRCRHRRRCRRSDDRPGGHRARRPKGREITSPMVGTFYRPCRRSRRPTSRSARASREDTVVCIIEAMKVMNEIKAEASGRRRRDPGRKRQARAVRPGAVPAQVSRIRESGRNRSETRRHLPVPRSAFRIPLPPLRLLCSTKSSSPTVARSPCASCAPAANWASRPWPFIPSRTWKASTSSSPTRPSASARPPAADSYLKIDRIISAAEIGDVDAIHPGYGFLAENAHFAEVCESCNIRFIGPPAERHPHDGRQERRPRGRPQGRRAHHPRQRRRRGNRGRRPAKSPRRSATPS